MSLGLIRHPRLYSLAQKLVSADYRAIRRAIRRELPLRPGQQVVDLGCGTGNLAGLFSQARYVGVDVHPTFVRFARKTTRRPYAVMDVAHLGLPDSAFDAAVAIGLNHHLDDETLQQFARQVRRVCKPATRVVIIDIIPPRSWNILERARQQWAERGRHIRHPEEYRRLLATHLTVERMYPLRWGFLEYSVLVLRVEKDGKPDEYPA